MTENVPSGERGKGNERASGRASTQPQVKRSSTGGRCAAICAEKRDTEFNRVPGGLAYEVLTEKTMGGLKN